jgi:copper homeostasis protein (lipoprotein)
MKILILFTASIMAACTFSAATSQEHGQAGAPGKPALADTAHNSRNALDWHGTYSGTVPCADCEGIRTSVTLRDDGSFERERLYLGKSAAPMRDSGRFSWNEAGSIITLVSADGGTQQYQVGENQLFHLDQAGNRIAGDLAGQYVLRQAVRDPRIEDRKWLLIEVMGAPYEPSDEGREAFLLLDSEQGRASGNNSCNNFFGGYVIHAGQRIRFADNMGATMMACPDMSTEQAFVEALRRVDNYSVAGDELSLNRARMAPLLRFRLEAETD